MKRVLSRYALPLPPFFPPLILDSRPLPRTTLTRVSRFIMPSTSLVNAGNGVQSANDNITRFNPPSRVLSPNSHALFHNKTRCFV